MRILYVNQCKCVGAYFAGRSKPIDEVARRQCQLLSIRQTLLFMRQTLVREKKCEIRMSYSSESEIVVTGVSNDKEFLSGRIKEMLTGVEAVDVTEDEQLDSFIDLQPYIIEAVREFARKHGKK